MAASSSDMEKGMEFKDGCELNADAVDVAVVDVAATLSLFAARAPDGALPENISMRFRWRLTAVVAVAFRSPPTTLASLLDDVAPSVC